MEGEMNVMTVAKRVLSEFEEMPGMTLTPRQASRLFGLNEELCQIVLDVLVDSAYLRQTPDGKVRLGYRVAA
jgi:DNA-binding IclR family transcriptional regulator